MALAALATLLAVGSAIAEPGSQRVRNVAHRGASGYAPEHTIAAYDLAISLGADYIEQDLQMTSDGVLVVLHDPDLDRTAQGPAASCSGLVATKTLAQVKTCDVGNGMFTNFPDRLVRVLEGTPVSPAACAPTAVTTASFSGARRGGGVVLRWRTSSEVGVPGFNVYSARNGQRTRLNRTLVPATAGLAGRLYRWRDHARRPAARYWLEEVHTSGRSAWYGPARMVANP